MADQPDLLNELPYGERVQLTERLKNAKKQRTLQLKGYEQREKRYAKEQALASKKSAKKSKKVACDEETSQDKVNGRRPRLQFMDSILMMDAVARNDIDEGIILFSFNYTFCQCSQMTEVQYATMGQGSVS